MLTIGLAPALGAGRRCGCDSGHRLGAVVPPQQWRSLALLGLALIFGHPIGELCQKRGRQWGTAQWGTAQWHEAPGLGECIERLRVVRRENLMRKIIAALALWLAPLPALAALAIDSQEASNAGHNSATSPLTWSFTNTAGTLLIVGACVNDTGTPTVAISGVTYNGVAMSAIAGTDNASTLGTASNLCRLYQLLSPATGAHTVSVSWTGGGGYSDAIGGAISFTGNNSTTPTGNPATASDTSGTSNSASVSLTGTASGDYVVSLVATGSGVGTATAPTAISWKLNVSLNDIGDNAALGQQTTSGGTVNAGFSVTADVWSMSAMEVFAAPAGGPVPVPNWLALMGVGGTLLNHGDGCPCGGGALAPGFFVSSTGNDNNPGTLASPWLTIFHAQQIMRGNNCNGTPTGLCLTYVRGGTYNITSTIDFTSTDSGETISYYPPDGVNTAVIDGGSTLDPIFLDGVSNITINGLKIQNSFSNAIKTQDGSGIAHVTGITIENCDIGFNQHTGASGGFNPMLLLENATVQVLNNYVHDSASQGIGLYAFYAGQSVDGSVISGNVVLRAAQQVSDGGAIYVNMRGTGNSGGHVTIKNNLVRDHGAPGVNDTHGVYLDDLTSNATVTGNVLGPPAIGIGQSGSGGILEHNGLNNAVSGNIIDLGSSTFAWTTVWYKDGGAGMTTETFTGNIVVSSFAGNQATNGLGQSGFSYYENSGVASDYTISANAYHNYGGGQERTDGSVASDASPQHYTSAQMALTCPNGIYSIGAGSTALGAPVNFPQLVGGWGPPSFTIPSSTNHSC